MVMNKRESTHWIGIGLTFIIGVVASIAISKASPALLVIQRELALNAVQVGWIMSSVSVATVLLGIIAGRLSQQYGPKRILQIALLLLFFSTSFSFLVESSTSIMAIRGIEGIAIILISVCAPTLISHLSKPTDTGLSMGVWSVWIPAGSFIVFLSAPLILQELGWRWLWFSTGIMAVPLLFLLRYIPNISFTSVKTNNEGNSKEFVFGAVVLSSVFVCFACILFSLLTFLPSYLINNHQLSSYSALWVSSLLPLCVIPGCALCSVLIHRGIRPTQMMIYPTFLVALVFSIVFNFQYSDGVGLLLLAFLGVTIGMIPTAIFAQAPRMPANPKNIGLVLGIVVTGQGVGILLGTPFVGLLMGETFNWQFVYFFYLVMSGAILLLAKPLNRLQHSTYH